MRPALHSLALFVALLLAGAAPRAQTCPSMGDTFWKNDTLPDVPGPSPTGISIVPGLCEGEAAGAVFTLQPGAPAQRLETVAVGFGHSSGGAGFQAAVNVEIYDGVTFDAQGIPSLGPKVFDLNQDAGADMLLTSTGLNVLDISTYGATVGNANGKFVVAFRMNINTTGSCASGHPANFFTDNSQFQFTCDPAITPPQKNLIDIQGQGWRDASIAMVGGFPLCPLFYSGNWAIRACTSDAGPANPLFVDLSSGTVPPGGFVNLTFHAPGFQGDLYVAAASRGTNPGIPTPHSGVIPLNFDALLQLSLVATGTFVNFIGVVGPAGTAPGLVLVPNDPGLAGIDFWVAFIAVPPGGPPWGVSSASRVLIQ